MSKYIPLIEFCEKNKLSPSILNAKNLPKNVVISDGRKRMVQESFFTRRKFFKDNVKILAQDYYFLLTEHINLGKLCKILSKRFNDDAKNWYNYFYIELFSLREMAVTNYKVSEKLWQFFRFARWFIIRIKRAFKLETNINVLVEKILDKKAGLL